MPSLHKRVGKIALWSLLGLLLLGGAASWWARDGLAIVLREWKEEREAAALKEALLSEVTHLPEVDEVLVLRLQDKPVTSWQKPFCKTHFDGTPLYEAQKTDLKGKEALALANLWRSQATFKNGAGCHEPHHALRFFHQGRQVSEVTICFLCFNAGIPTTGFGGALFQFDPMNPQYAALKTEIEGRVGTAP